MSDIQADIQVVVLFGFLLVVFGLVVFVFVAIALVVYVLVAIVLFEFVIVVFVSAIVVHVAFALFVTVLFAHDLVAIVLVARVQIGFVFDQPTDGRVSFACNDVYAEGVSGFVGGLLLHKRKNKRTLFARLIGKIKKNQQL